MEYHDQRVIAVLLYLHNIRSYIILNPDEKKLINRSKGIKISIIISISITHKTVKSKKISFRDVHYNNNSRTSGDNIYVDVLAVRVIISYLGICYFNHIQNSRSRTKHIYLHVVVTCYKEWLIL